MVDTDSRPAAKQSSWWKLAFNLALLSGLVSIFVLQVQKNWNDIVNPQTWHELRWDLAGVALVILLFCSLLDILIWNRALSWFAAPLPFVKVAPVFIWSNLARYIPGKVASLFLRAALATEADRPAVPVLAASALELALRTASALIIFVATLPTWGRVAQHAKATEAFFITGVIIIVVVLICAHPKMMMPVLNWTLKKIKQPIIEHTLRYRDVLGLIGLEMVRWVLVGISFVLLACAVYPPAWHAMLTLIGVANASWAAGFLSMTPAGLGMAEVVQNRVLASSSLFGLRESSIIPVILPVAARVWSLAAEGLWALAVWPLYYRWSRSTARK